MPPVPYFGSGRMSQMLASYELSAPILAGSDGYWVLLAASTYYGLASDYSAGGVDMGTGAPAAGPSMSISLPSSLRERA